MSARHEIWTKSTGTVAGAWGADGMVVPRVDNRFLRVLLGVLVLPLTLLALVVTTAAPASAAGTVSASASASNGFPIWYQDSAGNRVEPCIDPADANCVVLASDTFNPAAPTVFPSNFPDEFFYAIADSDILDTPGLCGTAPGKASVRLGLEGAFLGGVPSPTDRMVFGRIRVKVTGGLCPNTTYQFKHPFGTATFTTNGAGAVPANVGTEDIGCVPAPGTACNFGTATTSRVFGTAAAGGFLRWDPAVAPAAPAGYLGDGGQTLHAITGGTNGNEFRILTSGGADVVPGGVSTTQFGVAGKLAGSLITPTGTADLGGVALGSTSASKTISVTNVDRASVTLGVATVSSTEFSIVGGNCSNGRTMGRDGSCTYQVRFTPTGLAGRRSATLTIPSTGGVRSPLVVHLTAAATNVGDAPSVSLSTAALAFPSTRLRTTSSVQHLVITNTGLAPLGITDVSFDPATVPEPDQYRIQSDTCSTGLFVDPTRTCTIDVVFAPFVSGPHPTRLIIASNAGDGQDEVTITGTGTGGAAAVSASVESNGFPEWYRDEAGIKLAQCLDPADANCIVLGDPSYDPAQPLVWPTNFPGEFFYQVATSDIVTVGDRSCTTSTGKSFVRSAIEGTFADGVPVDGDQMVFGRVRFSVTGGLCPGTEYLFTSPYGTDSFTTDASGAVRRSAATDDVGCVPSPGAPCDFSVALSSRVLGGVVRWDPAVAPAAPAGYLGDGATPHRISGAPYSPDGVNPANYFQITRADNGVSVGRTDLFTVMGKLRGPLEADRSTVAFPSTAIGSTSAPETVTFTNTGSSPLTVTEVALAGFDGDDFGVVGDACTGATLNGGSTCTVAARFTPTATGSRSMSLALRHTGLNSPLTVALAGTGGAAGTASAISFSPRSLAFAPLHVGGTSPLQTITVSNAGGTLPLSFTSPAALTGPGAGSFTIVSDRCVDPVAPEGSCEIDVALTPNSAGALTASLEVHDDAPGLTHLVALTGRGSTAVPAASPALDPGNGFPTYYQDANGVRLEPCLDASGNCIVLGDATYDPGSALSFPGNFPGEFFYALADSNPVSTPGCAGTTPGTAFLRVALEGSFAGGAPLVGDQTTFGRIRIVVTSGLCPNTPYTFDTPYGAITVQTGANGGFARNVGTTDLGCGAAPCNFGDATASGPASSFLRWSPANGLTPPAGYLGDGVSFHQVVGGTYIRPGESQPVNEFVISDSAGNVVARSNQFLVSGKLAGPLQSDTASIAFGHSPVGTATASTTVTVTNVATTTTAISSVSLTGANAGDFTITGQNCSGASVSSDSSCTVRVAFLPTSATTRSAILRIVPASGPAVSVALSGLGDAVAAPAVSVTPGVLAYGTVTAPGTTSLTTTVRNTGTGPLLVGAPAVGGGAAADYTVTANSCTVAVAPGGTCTVTVAFRPTATGARTATLTIPHNATGSQTLVSLTGTGAGSTFALSPNPVKFGTVNRGTTKTATVTIKNSGTTAFRLTAAAVAGSQAGFFAVNGGTCIGSTLAAGKTCSIVVSFTPTAATGYNATLVVTGDSTSLPATQSIALQGTGK